MGDRDSPEYLLMGFFEGLVASHPCSRMQAREGDCVVFDRGRFRGVVTAVAASEGWMQVRVDLGAGKVGTQVLGWPAPTSTCPRPWELLQSSPRRSALVPSVVPGKQTRCLGIDAESVGPTTSNGKGRSSALERPRKHPNGSDEAEMVAMQHKCAKYRAKLSASESVGVEAKSGDERAGREHREENLSPGKRADYEKKLQHWETKLRKWNARAEKSASAKRRKRLKREREAERERVQG